MYLDREGYYEQNVGIMLQTNVVQGNGRLENKYKSWWQNGTKIIIIGFGLIHNFLETIMIQKNFQIINDNKNILFLVQGAANGDSIYNTLWKTRHKKNLQNEKEDFIITIIWNKWTKIVVIRKYYSVWICNFKWKR